MYLHDKRHFQNALVGHDLSLVDMEVDGKFKHCGPCSEDGNKVKADGLCQECEESMCTTCFKDHLKWKLHKNHVLVDTVKQDVPRNKSSEMCVEHSEIIKFYCMKHADIGCGECMVLEHNGCQLEYIKSLANDLKVKDEFKTILKQVQEIEDTSNRCTNYISAAGRNYIQNFGKLREEIKTFREEIEEKLITAEANMLENLLKRENLADSLLENLEARNKTALSEIRDIKQLLNSDEYSENGLFINMIKIKPKIKTMQANVSDIENKTDVARLAFYPNEYLKKGFPTTLGDFQLDSRPKGFQVFINGATLKCCLWVEPRNSIKNVKEQIQNKYEIPIESQVLSIEFTRKILQDDFTLDDYGICDLSKLKLTHNLQAKDEKKTSVYTVT